MIPISYLQTDAKWKSKSYSVKGEKTTIGRAGCGPTCAAMIVATLKNNKITPVEACAYALANGFKQKGGGTYANFYVSYLKQFGITAKVLWSSAQPQDEAVKKALNDGDWVIASMRKGLWTNGGHYILAYGTDGEYVYINDPASTKASRTKAKLTRFLSESKYYVIVSIPTEFKKDTPQQKLIKSMQKYCGMTETGRATTALLNKTVTIVCNGTNRQHPFVGYVQQYLKDIGIYTGKVHSFYDPLSKAAVAEYQRDIVGLKGKNVDGIITKKKYTWKKLLGL